MIRTLNIRDVTWLGAHMRERDKEELLCQFPDHVSPSAAAVFCLQNTHNDTGWLCLDRDTMPVAAFGFSPTFHPTLWSAWAFGTDKMRRYIPEITRFCLEQGVPHLLRTYGPRRIEVRALSSHDLAHRWLRGLGAEFECRLPNYGRNGEEFSLYSWTNEEKFWDFREKWYLRKESRKAIRDKKDQPDVLIGTKPSQATADRGSADTGREFTSRT